MENDYIKLDKNHKLIKQKGKYYISKHSNQVFGLKAVGILEHFGRKDLIPDVMNNLEEYKTLMEVKFENLRNRVDVIEDDIRELKGQVFLNINKIKKELQKCLNKVNNNSSLIKTLSSRLDKLEEDIEYDRLEDAEALNRDGWYDLVSLVPVVGDYVSVICKGVDKMITSSKKKNRRK